MFAGGSGVACGEDRVSILWTEAYSEGKLSAIHRVPLGLVKLKSRA